jgi:hypothetical protein
MYTKQQIAWLAAFALTAIIIAFFVHDHPTRKVIPPAAFMATAAGVQYRVVVTPDTGPPIICQAHGIVFNMATIDISALEPCLPDEIFRGTFQ